jgi:hypothetical protein
LPGYHTHDGFYLRLAVGGGYAHASASYQNQDVVYSGGAFALDMAFGGSVTPNLIIYGAIVGYGIPNPTLKSNGANIDMSGITFNAIGVGPGVTYYIMPENMYASGSLLLHFLSLSAQHSNQSADLSDTGVGFSLMFGKEWWVSSDWGLGVAGQFMFGSDKAKYVDARWTTVAGGVLFSATYN